MENWSNWLSLLLSLLQLPPHWFQRKELQELIDIRDELVKQQEFCQTLARQNDGYISLPNSVWEPLLKAKLKRLPLLVAQAQKAAEAKHKELLNVTGASTAIDQIAEISFLTFYHRLLSAVEDQFAAQWWVNRQIRHVIRARERYNQLEHMLRENLRAQIQHARRKPALPLTSQASPGNAEPLEQALLLSHRQAAALIQQMVRREKRKPVPETIFVEWILCKRRDLFLSQVEDALLAQAG